MKSNTKETNRMEEPSKFAIKFANTIFVLGILFSVLISVYAVCKIYNKPENLTSTFYYSYLLFAILAAILFVLGLRRLSNGLKVNLSVLFVTAGISTYAIEVYLNISDFFEKSNIVVSVAKRFEDKGAKWDYRTKQEYVNHLKKETNNPFIYPHYNAGGLIQSNFLLDIIDDGDIEQINKERDGLNPFSNISNSTIVHCNEYGLWQYFETDKYGFNNPNNIIQNSNAINITLLGDSFVEGFCMPDGEDIGSKLREFGFNVNNLGKADGGVIHANAIYREYSQPNSDFIPDYVIFFLYYLNDLSDTYGEYSNEIYRQYIDDKSFNQNLINKQDESDDFQKRYFTLLSNPKFLEKYPILVKYGQNIHYRSKKNENKKRIERNEAAHRHLMDKAYNLTFNQIASVIKLQRIRRPLSLFLNRRGQSKSDKKTQKILFKQIEQIHNEISKETKFIIVYLPNFEELQRKDYKFSRVKTSWHRMKSCKFYNNNEKQVC